MNPTDILGEILGGGSGGGLLKDIFGGRQPTARSTTQTTSSPSSPADYEQQIRDLEEQFGIRKGPGNSPSSRSGNWTTPPTSEIPPPLPEKLPEKSLPAEKQDAESLILIRAMIHAAKADGRLSREEQHALFTKLGGQSSEATHFLQKELNQDSDVRTFSWSVPLGMEYKVYAVSLAAIDLDTKAESDYLAELAHGLRLPLEVRQHLHQRYGAPAPRR